MHKLKFRVVKQLAPGHTAWHSLVFIGVIKGNVQHSAKHDGRARHREIVPAEVSRCRRPMQKARRDSAGVFAAAYAG